MILLRKDKWTFWRRIFPDNSLLLLVHVKLHIDSWEYSKDIVLHVHLSIRKSYWLKENHFHEKEPYCDSPNFVSWGTSLLLGGLDSSVNGAPEKPPGHICGGSWTKFAPFSTAGLFPVVPRCFVMLCVCVCACVGDTHKWEICFCEIRRKDGERILGNRGG